MNFLMCPSICVCMCAYTRVDRRVCVCVCVPLLGSLSGEAQILLFPLEDDSHKPGGLLPLTKHNPSSLVSASFPPPNSKGQTSKKSVLSCGILRHVLHGASIPQTHHVGGQTVHTPQSIMQPKV